ncbi:MAG TPA: hypothetical protein VM600_04665 [Actinomycetota bacterium]|nr:hypothetical protein [Actinomycetota bacterium]
MSRRAHPRTNHVRSWIGESAADPGIDETRQWVVWGGSNIPEEIMFDGVGNDIAEGIARAQDPQWAERDDRWVVVLRASESDVDALAADRAAVFGYAPYLVDGLPEEVPDDGYMEGTLRSDVAPRRKVEQPRPS